MIIVIICHFSNKEIQDIIKPNIRIREFAPWISNYIKEFSSHPEHEIHIISPHEWLISDHKFSRDNIHFYFFRRGVPVIGRRWPSWFDLELLTKYKSNKKKIRKYVEEINPDVINLIGAENPYYSSSILQFKGKYPVFLTIQGFAGRTAKGKISRYKNYRYSLEKKIINSFSDFCIRTEDMWKYIKSINPNAVAHRFNFPTPYSRINIPDIKKEYDFVFFARVIKEKGIYDYLEAIKRIQTKKQNVKAMIIGPCNKTMRDHISDFTVKNNLKDNINHVGFLETQTEVFMKVKSARISVLPTYNDLISGTIIESMFLELPVVACDTGSISEVNNNDEIISICKQGDVGNLTSLMYELLLNNEKASKCASMGNKWVTNRYDNKKAMNDYFSVLKGLKENGH